MTPYIVMLLIPVLYYLTSTKNVLTTFGRPSVNSRCVVLFFCSYLLLLVFRAQSVGIDLPNYLFYFSGIDGLAFDRIGGSYQDIEVGYRALNWVVGRFTDDFQVFMAVVAVLTVVPVCALYARESKSALLSMFTFIMLPLFSMFFSGLRQSLAISLVAASFFFVKKRKPFPFVCCIAVAFFFHKTALMALLLYPVYHMVITRRMLVAVVPVVATVFVFNGQIFSFLLPLVGEEYGSYAMTSTGAYGFLLLLALLTVVSFIVGGGSGDGDKSYVSMRNILLFSLMLQCFAPVQWCAMRMNYYYLLFLPLIVPEIFLKFRERNEQLASIAELAFCLISFVYFVNAGLHGADTLHIFPYLPFWEA